MGCGSSSPESEDSISTVTGEHHGTEETTNLKLEALKSQKRKNSLLIQRLEEKLFENNYGIVQSVCKITKIASALSVANDLVVIFHYHKEIVPLLRLLIEQEASKAESEGTLFRGNSITSKMMTKFFRQSPEVSKYLFQTLEKPLKYALENPEKHEVDPEKLSPDHSVEENQVNLINTSRMFVDAIVTSAPFAPRDLKLLLQVIAEKVALRFPDSTSKYSALAGVLILRFFAPIIVTPTEIGIIEKEDISSEKIALIKRTLILISKVLQNSSTGVEFGKKENFFYFYNEHLVENKEKFRKFFDEIIVLIPESDEQSGSDQSNTIESEEIVNKKAETENKLAMISLTEYLHSIQEDMKKEFSSAPWFSDYSSILDACFGKEKRSRRTQYHADLEKTNLDQQRPKSIH